VSERRADGVSPPCGGCGNEEWTVDQVFGIAEQSVDGTSVVTVSGEVDVATAPAVRDCLNQVIDRDRGLVVADLSGVTFIDSTGLGVLIGAHRRCADSGRPLRVVVVEPRIRKVFEITGLTELFPIHPSLDLALAGEEAGRT
jgi:anti-sigma B factor antagonist